MMRADTQPVLALLHGWGIGNTAWDPVLPVLSREFEVRFDARLDIRPIALPGYDTSETPINRPSSSTYLVDTYKQSDLEPIACRSPIDGLYNEPGGAERSFIHTAEAIARRLPDACFLAGWSLGAMLALEIAQRAPQRVKGLILIGGTPCFTQHTDWPHAQAPALLDTFCAAVKQEATATRQRFIGLLNQGDRQARTIGRALSKRLLAAHSPDTITLLTGLGWLREVDLRAQIAAIDTPTLLIHGQHDPLMPLAAARWLQATLPNARLDVFADAAHAPFLNNPEQFAALIGDFSHAITHP